MSTTYRVATALLTVIAASSIAVGLATSPALAATASGEVIATDSTSVIAVSDPVSAAPRAGARVSATAPREVSVVGHSGKPVTLSAKGEPVRRVPRPGTSPATFTGLTAGTTYTARIAGKKVGTVTAVDRPSAASALSVRTTDRPDSVDMTWQHRSTRATGGSNIDYTITATSPTAPTVTTKVHANHTATVAGLDPAAIYTFTVTPANGAGSGKPTKAAMTRSLASIKGLGTVAIEPTAPDTTPTTPKATAPAPAPAPAPGTSNPSSGPSAGPRTTTIYVCPDGYAANGDLCQQTRAYTFHTVTETSPYTYHQEFVITGGSWVDRGTDWSGTTCPNGGTMHSGHCMEWVNTGYYTSVKDNPPTGFTDDGSQYVRVTQVKDDLPAGFSDDGTQWVKTVAKESRTVTV